MKPVIITADSTVDLSQDLIDRYDIRIIPLTIQLGDESFLDGLQFTPADMYARYHKDGLLPKTSAPNTRDFVHFFRPLLEAGYEIVHLDISSELSNSFNAARLAAQDLEGVYLVDSRMLSTGIGLLAIEGAECRDRGMSAADIAAHLTSLTGKVSTSFVLDTLEFMWKGGRCTGVAALGANLLKIKPALEMHDGRLMIYKKYRGRTEKVYRQYIAERLAGKSIRPGHIFLTESGEIDPAVVEELTAYVKELSGAKEVHHTIAGCTISSHCGPRCLGVLFIEE
ncbi:MAG: DegV family protein [Lachnospiraceae bacterium]|nr:DegV family protein [Lachnospiraceae bacterium]MBQ9592964.1 DegV family protein [Lachnospiraceae bacterium]